MFSYEEWLIETGRDNTEDSHYEYLQYIKQMEEFIEFENDIN